MSRRAIGITCWLLLYSMLTLDPLQAQTADDQSALAKALESISRERLLSDISTLSGPEFNGRQAGSRDDLTTALWFQEQFQMAVQHPLDSHNRHSPSVLPESTLTRSVRVSSIAVAPVVQIGTTPDNPASELGSDYLPILDSPSIDLRAQIAFVGYGIADPASGFDEYNGIDVHNRIVLFLRGKPEHYAPLVSHADKVRTAKAKGAVGYLTATGPLLSAYEARRGMTGRPSALYGLTDDDMSLSGAWISTDIANRILTGHEPGPRPSLRELQETINRTLRPQSRMTDADARLSWLTEQTSGTLYTLPITFPSTEADAGEDMIIIGAHRDHFGRQAGLLFPGADDNASGTAVLLEVAVHRQHRRPVRPGRRVPGAAARRRRTRTWSSRSVDLDARRRPSETTPITLVGHGPEHRHRPPPARPRVNFSLGGAVAGSAAVGALAAGASTTVSVNAGTAADGQLHRRGGGRPDQHDRRAERRQQHLHRTDASWWSAQAPGPDLQVLSITSNPPNPAVGAPVTFTVAVNNRGTAATGATTVTRLTVGSTTLNTNTASIAAGATVNVADQRQLDRHQRRRHHHRHRRRDQRGRRDQRDQQRALAGRSWSAAARPSRTSSYEAEAANYQGTLLDGRPAAHLRAHQLRHRVLRPAVGAAEQHRASSSSSPRPTPANSIVVRNSIPDAAGRRRHRGDHQPVRQRHLRAEADPVVAAQLALRQHRRTRRR